MSTYVKNPVPIKKQIINMDIGALVLAAEFHIKKPL
jgi:hypothetical protein